MVDSFLIGMVRDSGTWWLFSSQLCWQICWLFLLNVCPSMFVALCILALPLVWSGIYELLWWWLCRSRMQIEYCRLCWRWNNATTWVLECLFFWCLTWVLANLNHFLFQIPPHYHQSSDFVCHTIQIWTYPEIKNSMQWWLLTSQDKA